MPATLSQRRIRTRRFSLLAALTRMNSVRRQRRALEQLDDAALKDIGLTRDDVRRELRRPIWDAPNFWRW